MARKKRPQPMRFSPDMAGVELVKQGSNKTKISRSAGEVFLNCPICQITFSRKASEAKRNAVSYCSKACCGVGQRIRVATACRICGKEYAVKKSSFGVITCCSAECKSKAASLDVSKRDVKDWMDDKFKSGEASRFAKLTKEMVVLIRLDKRRHADIAAEYGVTRAAISHLKSGRTWSRITI